MQTKAVELDMLNHPSNYIYRAIRRDDEIIIKRCDGEYTRIITNSRSRSWVLVKNQEELLSVYKYMILNGIDFESLFKYGDGTLDNR